MQVEHEHPQKQHGHLKDLPPQEQDSPGVESKMDPKPDHGEESYKGSGRLKDKIAIVTGGDSGIGKAVCIAFAREGCDIVCAYLNEHDDAKDTKKWVEKAGRKCHIIAADLSDQKGCELVIEETRKAFGDKWDILVNNAAFQGKAVKDIKDLDYDRVLYTFKTNIISMFELTRLSVPHMREGGSVINTSSIQTYNPSAGILDYASTKGAITTFTKGLAEQIIEKGLRSNCVAPGPIWTPLVVASFDNEKIKKFGQNTPAGRPGMPAELAGAYVFLASNESQYVNGEVLGVTGGRPLG